MSCVRFAWVMLVAAMFVAASDVRAEGWFPRPGIEVSGIYGTVSNDFLDRPYGGGWSAGATAEWMLAPSWSVVSGLRYLESGDSQTLTIAGSGTGGTLTMSGDIRDTWRWLAVPMHVKVTPWALPLSL